MSSPATQPFNILEKAKSDSVSDKNHKIFIRVESRFTKAAKEKLKGQLSQFRREGAEMSPLRLANEKHSSKLLGEFLRSVGLERPGARWEAHHIISGDHPESQFTRALIADEIIKIRIDDPDNGCWMPKTKADARPTIYPNAIGHNRIHRDLYYQWISNAISIMDTDVQIRAFLSTVRVQLLHGNIKEEMKLQQEIDGAEYADWLKKNKKL
jgi:hypothetical protein